MTNHPPRAATVSAAPVARAAPSRPRGGAAKPASPAVTPVAAGLAGPIALSMSEAALEGHMRKIIADLRGLGGYLLASHPYDSRRSPEGYPDWTFAGEGGVAWRELKRESGRLTKAQEEWLAALTAAGMDAAVWRPSHLLSGQIGRELAALAGLGEPGGAA